MVNPPIFGNFDPLSNNQIPIEGKVVNAFVDPTLLATLDYNDPTTYPLILQGAVLRFVGNLVVNKCDGTHRDQIAGIARTTFPEPTMLDVKYFQNPDSPLQQDIKFQGAGKYSSKSYKALGNVMSQAQLVLVEIPANGSDITIVAGDKIVPCTQTGSSGVEALSLPTVAGANPTKAEYQAGEAERDRVIGTALTNIHTAFRNGRPALGQNNNDTLTHSATAIVRGWIWARINV